MSRERHRVTWLHHHHAHSAEDRERERERGALTNPPRPRGGGGGGPLSLCSGREGVYRERVSERELDEASGLVAVELSSRVVSSHPDSSQTIPEQNKQKIKGQLEKR